MSAVALDPVEAVLAVPGDERCEFADGRLIPMSPPSTEHSDAMGLLYAVMRAYAETKGAGQVKPDSYAQRVRPGVVRIPDVAFFRESSAGRMGRTHSEGASDLIVEVVSPDSRVRDRRDKFYEYATAGVEEYWIVDPNRRQCCEFVRLVDGAYEPVEPDAEGRVFSSVLPGFFVRVGWLWNGATLIEAMRELGLV